MKFKATRLTGSDLTPPAMYSNIKHNGFVHNSRKVIILGLIVVSLTAGATLIAQDRPKSNDQVIYVDCEINVARSTTYDPATRKCGDGSARVFRRLQSAANSVVPGQTVMLRQGRYNEQLKPIRSGQADSYITFKSYPGEQATITGERLDPAVQISGKSYIVIEGLKIANVRRWLHAVGSHHNIIRKNHFFKALHKRGSSKTGLFFREATFNVIADNIIEDSTQDNLSLIKSDRNLVVGNTFRKARHALWTIKGGNFNVLRDNYFHNELQKIGEVFDCHKAGFYHKLFEYDCTKYNLITGNRFAFTPSSGRSTPYPGIQYAGQNGIIRNNLFYDTTGPGLCISFYGREANYSTYNHIYNNVFYQTSFAGIHIAPSKKFTFHDNVIKNNVLAQASFVANDTRWRWYRDTLAGAPMQMLVGSLEGFICSNNDFFSDKGGRNNLIMLGYRKQLGRYPHNIPSLQRAHSQLFQDG